jgi:hypothetical protein
MHILRSQSVRNTKKSRRRSRRFFKIEKRTKEPSSQRIAKSGKPRYSRRFMNRPVLELIAADIIEDMRKESICSGLDGVIQP